MHFASILVLIAILTVALSYGRNELVLQEDLEWVVKTKLRVMSKGELPASLDYRTQGLLTTDLNQHIPVYCGSYVKLFNIIFFSLLSCVRLSFTPRPLLLVSSLTLTLFH
jgi:hypothetical protein